VENIQNDEIWNGLKVDGQKQLLCLARAIVCKNKIVILNEVTAHVDPEIELMIIIQNSTRRVFSLFCYNDEKVLILKRSRLVLQMT
jgi:ABC-type polar amino acid transport system ATPase subunit